MLFYSTSQNSAPVTLSYAVLKGLADDGGLYMPENIPSPGQDFFDNLHKKSLHEIAFVVSELFLKDEMPADEIRNLVEETLNFDIPLVQIENNIFSLELFHGPTMAFKDVGARFMSRLMAYLLRDNKKNLKVIVATSGDTGSAVAAGFYNVPGIDVYVLFPKGKVSPLQQKQITTWGGNITAIETDGTFDDCQKLAKQVLTDKELNEKFLITSANSINIARLIPQSFYYFYAAAQIKDRDLPLVFSVPSGNFGNLTAGLMAAAMGLKVDRFIAATNRNDVVPEYTRTTVFTPRPSVQTMSNAMDVGNPSNFARMLDLFGNSHDDFCREIVAYSYSDQQTKEAIEKVLNQQNYLMDPHGAVAWLGAHDYMDKNPGRSSNVIFFETAHPAKFPETLKIVLERHKELPTQLKLVSEKPEHFISMENNYEALKGFLMDNDFTAETGRR